MAVSAGAIRAGRAFVELFADDSKLAQGLRAAQAKIQRFGSKLRGIGLRIGAAGAAVLTPILGAAKAFATMGDNVAKASKRTGVGVEALSELNYAAGQSGVAVEDLEKSLSKMQRTTYDASTGTQMAVDTFEALGMTVKSLEGLAPEDQFKLLAERLSRVVDPGTRAALAMELFGRSGVKLLPMLADGAAGIEALQHKARQLGLTMSSEDARAAEVFADALDDMWKTIKRGTFIIGAAVGPALTKLVDWLTTIIVAVNNWVDANRPLVVTITKIAAVVVGVGAALVAVGVTISAFGIALGGIVAVGAIVAKAVLAIAVVIGSMFSPLGLVILLLANATLWFLKFTETGNQALDWLADRFRTFKAGVLDTFGGIADALMAGDLGLAAEVLWTSLKVIWERGTLDIRRVWELLRTSSQKVVLGMWHGVQAAYEIGRSTLESVMLKLYYGSQSIWTRLSNGFMDAWDGAILWVSKRLIDLQGVFDDALDVEDAKKILEADIGARIVERETEKNKDLDKIEADKRSALKSAEDKHQANLAAIGQENIDANRELDEESNKRIATSEAELKSAKEQWRLAIARAKAAREEKESRKPDRFKLDVATDEDVELPIRQQLGRTKGTFNASSVLSLLGGDAFDRTATATERTVKELQKLNKAVEEGDSFI